MESPSLEYSPEWPLFISQTLTPKSAGCAVSREEVNKQAFNPLNQVFINVKLCPPLVLRHLK